MSYTVYKYHEPYTSHERSTHAINCKHVINYYTSCTVYVSHDEYTRISRTVYVPHELCTLSTWTWTWQILLIDARIYFMNMGTACRVHLMYTLVYLHTT